MNGAHPVAISNIYSFTEEPSPQLRGPPPILLRVSYAGQERAKLFEIIAFSRSQNGRRWPTGQRFESKPPG